MDGLNSCQVTCMVPKEETGVSENMSFAIVCDNLKCNENKNTVVFMLPVTTRCVLHVHITGTYYDFAQCEKTEVGNAFK